MKGKFSTRKMGETKWENWPWSVTHHDSWTRQRQLKLSSFFLSFFLIFIPCLLKDIVLTNCSLILKPIMHLAMCKYHLFVFQFLLACYANSTAESWTLRNNSFHHYCTHWLTHWLTYSMYFPKTHGLIRGGNIVFVGQVSISPTLYVGLFRTKVSREAL
jgi:hypothetical protein